MDDDWPVADNNATLTDTMTKMVGGNTSAWTNGSTFPNLSARQTSREFENETEIHIPYRHYYVPPSNVPQIDAGLLGGDIPIHQYAEVINGTMNLGKVFAYNYTPHFGQFQCQSTHFRRSCIADISHALPPGDELSSPATFQMGNQPSLGGVDGTMHSQVRGNPDIDNASMIPAEPLAYQSAKIENQHQWNFKTRPEPRRQPKFIIGMQFLRNNDDTLLVANWEVMMSFKCTIECKMGNSGLYGLYSEPPISQFLYPTVQMGNYGTLGSTAAATAQGYVTRDYLTPTSRVLTRGVFNKNGVVGQIRVATDQPAFPQTQFPPVGFTSTRRSERLRRIQENRRQFVEANASGINREPNSLRDLEMSD